jgi:late competence protein required for DNA uptake (superfamily II DNA/RNA helicase)
MIPSKISCSDEVTENISLQIIRWCQGKERVLNIISVPYNSPVIFLDSLLDCVKNKKKVLYITAENEEKVSVISNLKKFTDCRSYAYIRKRSASLSAETYIYITNYEVAKDLSSDYDLVIYDDISCFPCCNKYEILELLAAFYKEGARIISWSVESVFRNSKTIDIPVKDCRLPLCEPRVITTRIDVNKDIPYVVYDYLSWSIKSERKIIIYVPDAVRGENVYKYLWKLRENLHNNIMYYQGKSDMKKLLNFISNKKGIIIMDYFQDFDAELKDTDIIVYFADDKIFDYKKLLYICGKVGRSPGLSGGEVIFLARECTRDIEITKDLTRSFNKMAWEMGLLRL